MFAFSDIGDLVFLILMRIVLELQVENSCFSTRRRERVGRNVPSPERGSKGYDLIDFLVRFLYDVMFD